MANTKRGGTRQPRKPARRAWDWLANDPLIARSKALPDKADVAAIQAHFDDALPKQWVTFVDECGTLMGYGRALLGLTPRGQDGTTDGREDALDILVLLKLTEPTFSSDLLPIEILPDRQLHCVVVGGERTGSVVLVDLDRPEVRVNSARSVADFVSQWVNDIHAIDAVVADVLARDGDTLLRPEEWSTRRLCSQNVIVALLQMRHNRDTNERDVAVCATANLTSFAEGASTRWALTTILTEAHQAGGSLAVNFVRRERIRDGDQKGQLHPQRIQRSLGRIPVPIIDWGAAHGVDLRPQDGRWDHATGAQLLLAATRMPDSLRALLGERDISSAAVCAAIATGTWPALDVEYVIRSAYDPIRILTGTVDQLDRLRYCADQQVVRHAMVLAALRRHLERASQPSASDDDDTVSAIETDMSLISSPQDALLQPVTFRANGSDPLAVHWPVVATGSDNLAGDHLQIRVLAAEVDVLAVAGPDVIKAMTAGETLIVSGDALAAAHHLESLTKAANKRGVQVLAAPEYTTTLDMAIAARLSRARMSRQ